MFHTRDKANLIHTTEQIGEKQALTPEGFLLCSDVPISRTGTMIYGPGEIPLEPGKHGVVYVTRDAAALFSPETLASYNGKAVVDEHPSDDVNPTNWKRLAIGVTMNPRRGSGADSDVMLADLLITDASAIKDIRAGKREVSAGYDANYQQTGDGEGVQSGIIGNHVALVQRGRCGPRCAIGDQDPTTLQKENVQMGTKTQGAGNRPRRMLPESVRRMVQDAAAYAAENPDLIEDASPMGDATGGDEGGDTGADAGGEHTHIHIHQGEPSAADAPVAEAPPEDPVEARFAALEQGLAEITQQLSSIAEQMGAGGAATPADLTDDDVDGEMLDDSGDDDDDDDAGDAGEDDPKSKTGDSQALAAGFKQLTADAEILVPGFRAPTFDSKRSRRFTVDGMCSLRRKVTDHLYATAEGKVLLETVSGGTVKLAGMPCPALAALFKSAAGAKRLMNNAAGTRDARTAPGPGVKAPVIRSLADLNKLHAAFHTKH